MVEIDWNNLSFEYKRTNCFIHYTYKNGKWGKGILKKKPTITMSIAATCLHYGQACFEGLKAFRCRDGKIRAFRPDENLNRMNNTARYIYCPTIPEEMFFDAINRVVKANEEYIPPYETEGSLYIRPLLIGTGPRIGVAPSDQYDFIVLVVPVGPYYKGKIKPVDAIIPEDFDRAAPKGTGHIKLAGNYAAGLKAHILAKEKGFPIVLYLDAKTRRYIDEFGTSNFVAITKDGRYITPDSTTILPSITNKSLSQLAGNIGIKVEHRQIALEELGEFVEVGACGTAVVITPVKRIVYGEKVFTYGEECGPVLKKLYECITSIYYGKSPDTYGWLKEIK